METSENENVEHVTERAVLDIVTVGPCCRNTPSMRSFIFLREELDQIYPLTRSKSKTVIFFISLSH